MYVESFEELLSSYERLDGALDLVFLHSPDDVVPFGDLVKRLQEIRSATEILVAVRPEDMQEALSGVFLRRDFLDVIQHNLLILWWWSIIMS